MASARYPSSGTGERARRRLYVSLDARASANSRHTQHILCLSASPSSVGFWMGPIPGFCSTLVYFSSRSTAFTARTPFLRSADSLSALKNTLVIAARIAHLVAPLEEVKPGCLRIPASSSALATFVSRKGIEDVCTTYSTSRRFSTSRPRSSGTGIQSLPVPSGFSTPRHLLLGYYHFLGSSLTQERDAQTRQHRITTHKCHEVALSPWSADDKMCSMR